MRLAVLVRSESIKTFRRPAFAVTVAALVALLLLTFGAMHVRSAVGSGGSSALPNAWANMLNLADLPGVFAAILIILLVASEFSWRTARQNVIDGLTKGEFFAAKLCLVPAVALGLYFALIATGVAFALPGMVGKHVDALVRPVDAMQMGGAALQCLGMATIGFFCGIVIQSPGPATGVFLLYVVVDQLLEGVLRGAGGVAGAVASSLPWGTFTRLGKRVLYDPGAVAAAIGHAGRSGPVQVTNGSTTALVALATLYIVAIVCLSYLIFRKRDL
jgi:ABC-2 type transport system permease protein